MSVAVLQDLWVQKDPSRFGSSSEPGSIFRTTGRFSRVICRTFTFWTVSYFRISQRLSRESVFRLQRLADTKAASGEGSNPLAGRRVTHLGSDGAGSAVRTIELTFFSTVFSSTTQATPPPCL